MKTRGISYFITFALVLSLLGAEGCPSKKATTTSGLGAYIGGTSGLDMSFVDLEPPSEILDNNQDPFYITLFVENMGEYVIPKGKIIATLSGINKEAFGIKSLSVKSQNDIFGRSRVGTEVLEGGIEELQFDQANYKSDLTANFATQLRVDVCYNYKTDSLIKLCLKKNPKQREQEDLCSVSSSSISVENSGAPVHVKEVKSVGGVETIMFTFIVENDGVGEVYENNAFSDSCVLKSEKKDKVNVKVKSQSGGMNIKCGILDNGDSGVIRLAGGRKTVSCSIKTSSLQETSFEEPFEINLEYFYKDAVGKSLTVIDS